MNWYLILLSWTHITADADNHVHFSVLGFNVQQDHSEKYLFKVCIDVLTQHLEDKYVAKVWWTFQCTKSLQGACLYQITAVSEEALCVSFQMFSISPPGSFCHSSWPELQRRKRTESQWCSRRNERRLLSASNAPACGGEPRLRRSRSPFGWWAPCLLR